MWTRGCSLPTTGTEGIQNEKAALKKNAGDGRWKGERDGRQWELLATGLDLQPGICIKILGDIPPDAKQFGNDTKVIVCNSREDFYLGREIREKHFLFEQGTMVEVSISFEGKQFKIKLHDDSELSFPDHLNLQSINYMEISHDFKLKLLSFE
ncbi:galectin-1-like isoform X5 [Notamacropus eugenii]|uniref:galectin-1-like isoform X5 n=1 Tax=Notamacropus eugenii TaxID=9315 RepID=UPI003B67147B